ncbi:E3 ubiquitin-protein ligase HECTD3-like isoform 2-T2 [Clarias gariepinus]|uniref:E3 ubiquitin-protein ligase HECTD3-like isoform X2 n=1 Tax=Clarias gariepinus TaxID=13013 RepID=UPI00234CFFCF|nr:E3 ubiquitin-protein ligase HECTD3-like isoform X2 [Clarias gariepinus]
MSVGGDPHLLLGRIRFLNRCIECLRRSEPLPESLCFVPKEVCYKICRDSSCSSVSSSSSASTSAAGTGGIVLIPAWESPHQAPNKKSCKFTIEPKKGSCIRTSGEEYYNSHGLWVKITKEQMEQYQCNVDLEECWILACKHTEGGTRLVPVEHPDSVTRQRQIFGFDHKLCNRWEEVVDAENCLHLGARPKITERDEAAVQKLRYTPPTWTFKCDGDLVHYFYDNSQKEDETLGSAKQYVNSIDVSSCMDLSQGAACLTDGDPETFWQSDISQGQAWIRLTMMKGTVVSKLMLRVDSTDDTYMPKHVTVYGGEGDNLKKYSDVTIENNLTGEVCVLEEMTSHLPIIEIRIEECQDGGIEVRIRGLMIKSSERDPGLNADMFKSSNLVRYPRLEGTPPDVLYRRMQLILRFITILDRLLPHLVPTWNYSLGTFNQIKNMKQFLLLSRRRSALITQCLKDSESNKLSSRPSIYINRRRAMEHRQNPSLDPKCKHAVFTQVYEGLKTLNKSEKTLDYRWPACHDQWWECKFIGEGIIDQGGGFRDSLSDMSEELCPSSAECPIPLPFFIRSSNQGAGEERDFYVPNPSCRDFQKLEWIGQLMGAAFRGKDFLVLALPGLVWKQLIGETVSWNEDFPAVDSMLVKLLDAMEHMDKATFEFKFGQELVYSTPLSDGRLVELIPGGSSVVVRYEDRVEFTHLVQKARLEESREQIAAIQAGLMKVVPQAVLDLLTWQEVEKKVCGDPEITVEALKRQTRLEFLDQNEVRVQHMWEALTNFTNEDRSRFLRFVTGRSRLPAPICIYPDKQGLEITDALPQSSTCSSFLYLPEYPSAKVCEEKLRYAAYNCVAIDTDMNTWEE